MDDRYVIGKVIQRGRLLSIENESLRDFQHSANLYLELAIDSDAGNPFAGTALSAPCRSRDDTVVCPVMLQDDGKHYILLRDEVFKNAGEVGLSIGGISEDKIVVTSNMIKLTISDSGSIKAEGTPPETYWEIEVLNAMKAWYSEVVDPTFDASNEKLNQLIRRTEEHEEKAEELQQKVQEQQNQVADAISDAEHATQTANTAATNANEEAAAANTAAQAANKAKSDADTAAGKANKAASDANAAASDANTKAGAAAAAASEANAARDSANTLTQTVQQKLANGDFDGRTTYNGIGEPAVALGKDGDTYLNKSNEGQHPKWLYLKEGGKWTPLWNTQGIDGTDTVPVGAGYLISGDTVPPGYKETTPPFSNPNLLINGDFQVWQRGTSLTKPNAIHNEYLADGWMIFASANIQNLVVSKSDFGGIRFQNNGDNGYFCIIQHVELDGKQMFMNNGEKVTLSFEIDSNMSFNTQCTITPNSVIEYEVKQGKHKYEFNFDFISDEETMSRGYFNVYPFTSNIMIPNGADFTVKRVKTEVGSLATPFVPRPYAEELMLCQRYGRYICVDFTMNAASNSFSNMMSVPIDMRIAPTLTLKVDGTMSNLTGEKITYSAFTDHILFSFTASAAGMIRVYGRKYWADAGIY